MPKFSTHVALMDPEYKPANFAPGDEVPEWAIEQVGAHVLEREEVTESDDAGEAGKAGESETADEADGQTADDEDGDDADGEDDTPPPADEQPDFTAPAPARRGRARKQ